MLHHAVLGSMGRFIGILLEQHEGRLPFWLAPRQVAVLPIAAAQQEAAGRFHEALRAKGIKSVLLDQGGSLQRWLVEAHELMVPVHAVVGAREATADQVMLQIAVGKEALPVEEAVRRLRGMR